MRFPKQPTEVNKTLIIQVGNISLFSGNSLKISTGKAEKASALILRTLAVATLVMIKFPIVESPAVSENVIVSESIAETFMCREIDH